LTAIRSHRFHHISSTEFFFVFEAYNSSHISATIPLATARPKPETKTLRPHFLLSIFRTACREKKKEKKKKKGEKKKKKKTKLIVNQTWCSEPDSNCKAQIKGNQI
jgi:hypothetical protein